jgi:hypothetical protein
LEKKENNTENLSMDQIISISLEVPTAQHGFEGKFSAYKIIYINLHVKRHARASGRNVIGNNF